jgi:UDP-N-acetylglucosamine 2-epimerase
VNETRAAIDRLGMPTLWFWPNVDAGSDGTSGGIRAYREAHALPHVHFFKNLPPEDFLRVLMRASCIVGNSSVAIRECAFLGVPAVNIGSRQAGRDRGRNVIDVPHDRDAIIAAVQRHVAGPRPGADPIYGSGDAGDRIAAAIAGATLTIEKRLPY